MQEAYKSSWEHISDELKRLDLLIKLRVFSQRRALTAKPHHKFRGLVIDEEEISGLFADDESLSLSADDTEIRQILSEINATETSIKERRAGSLENGVYLSLPHLSQLFQLTPFEEQCLVVCLAPEINRKYEKLFSYIQDDVTMKKPCVDMVINLLCSSVQEKLSARPAFYPSTPLLKYRLLQLSDAASDNPTPLISRSLKLDDRIAEFLLGFGHIDARIEKVAKLTFHKDCHENNALHNDLFLKVKRFINTYFKSHIKGRHNIIFYLYGPAGSGKKSIINRVCNELGIPLLCADAEQLLAQPVHFDELAWLLGRESVLQQSTLCIENPEQLLENEAKHSSARSLIETINTFSRLTFIVSERPCRHRNLFSRNTFIEVEFNLPEDAERKQLWEKQINGWGKVVNDLDPGELAGKFRFTKGRIEDAVNTARNLALWRSGSSEEIKSGDINDACRLQSDTGLSALARKLNPVYIWDDIVLPGNMKNQLRDICNYVKYRHIVFGEWGLAGKFSMGKGLNVLFSGYSGTGKTMAAEIIAKELNLDIYRIDLSQVVSKYIGETEKNLNRIFSEAGSANAILFFDEADALFGKRSEVRDAHDRYANIEIAYLLQKMEEYDGIVILATNMRNNMDEAFVRRIHFIADFPLPDEDHREKIWLSIFPKQTPLNKDIDFRFLARQFRLSGGNIRNVAFGAAFLAASDGGEITMNYLIRSVQREYGKMGKLCIKGDFREYYEVLEGETKI